MKAGQNQKCVSVKSTELQVGPGTALSPRLLCSRAVTPPLSSAPLSATGRGRGRRKTRDFCQAGQARLTGSGHRQQGGPCHRQENLRLRLCQPAAEESARSVLKQETLRLARISQGALGSEMALHPASPGRLVTLRTHHRWNGHISPRPASPPGTDTHRDAGESSWK